MKKDLRKLAITLLTVILVSIIYIDYGYKNNAFGNYFGENNTSNKADNLKDLVFNGDLIGYNELKNLKDSGIKKTSFKSNSLYYPYYELLSAKEKKLYGQIYENCINYKTTFVPNVNVNKDEFIQTIAAVYNDHPEIFWLNTNYSYKYLDNGKIVQIILSYNYLINDIDNAKNIFEKKINTIVNGANQLSTNYDKEKYVHDYLINNTSYDVNAKINQSAYSAIVNGRSVCAGYSRAFQYIMNLIGIPTYYVTGYSSGEHAWNIVKLDDGYYNVDVTWDDKNGISYSYFNLTDNDISSTHKRRGLSNYIAKCNATNYSVNYTTPEQVEEINEPVVVEQPIINEQPKVVETPEITNNQEVIEQDLNEELPTDELIEDNLDEIE